MLSATVEPDGAKSEARQDTNQSAATRPAARGIGVIRTSFPSLLPFDAHSQSAIRWPYSASRAR